MTQEHVDQTCEAWVTGDSVEVVNFFWLIFGVDPDPDVDLGSVFTFLSVGK